MRIPRKLVVAMGLMIGLVTVGVPVRAHGAAIIGSVDEGASGASAIINNAFTITNPNAFAVTLTALGAGVTNNSDASDALMGPGATVTGGTCVALLAVNGGFAANASCTVSLTVTPTADVPENEPIDVGMSDVQLTYRIDNGPLMSQTGTVLVNDVPVPEPEPATMVGLGIIVLLGAAWAAKRREVLSRRFLTIG